MSGFGGRAHVVLGAVAALAALAARPAPAQQPQVARRWELPGPRLDFSPDGVWRRKARQIARTRAAALGRSDFALLNAPLLQGAPSRAGLSLGGTLRVPAVLLRFADTDTTALRAPADYGQALFGAGPPAGRPYTVRTLFEEMSNGAFSIQGDAIGWVALANLEAAYTGPAGTCAENPYTGNGNGYFCGAYLLTQAGLREAILRADSQGVDWGRYDNDGPDGLPNSGDDDGFVDLAMFVQPMMDGACVARSNNHIWAHSYWFNVATSTRRAGAAGGYIAVRDYTIQSGVGGNAACDSTQMMPIGTVSHETGHGIGLPDLYDTDPSDGDDSEGIGHWGLMGSGNYATPLSPAGLEAFSRNTLGWVLVRPLGSSGTYGFGPTALGDTAFLVRPTGANPRGEYYLLENRQAVQNDSALIRMKAPGLLVWHVDSSRYHGRLWYNDINSGTIHGVVLVEADGANNLLSSVQGVRNRGDASDPFPGAASVTLLGSSTNPRFNLNSSGWTASPGFVLEDIAQLAQGAVQFRLTFGASLVVAASDAAALVRVDGQPTARFQRFLGAGSTVTVAVDSAQTDAAGTTQYLFQRWSDGGARGHVVTMGARDTAITATVSRRFDVRWTVSGPGAVTASPDVPAAGGWVSEGDSVVLVARPGAGAIFMGWVGDLSSSQARVVLQSVRPYNLTATFSAASVDSVVRHLVRGTGLASAQATALDAQGNRNGRFDLGDFVAWLDQTGTAVGAEVLARVFQRAFR